tara:strand:+ start:624 stop:758 length:135 start_codon:yes stop_codon:yes gene_type:complete
VAGVGKPGIQANNVTTITELGKRRRNFESVPYAKKEGTTLGPVG